MILYLDMDGVISDFFDSSVFWFARKHLGLSGFASVRYVENTYLSWPNQEWDIPKVLGVSDDVFWKVLDDVPGFWPSILPYKDMSAFVECLKDLGDVVILSSPARSPHCIPGKRFWLHKWLSDDLAQTAIFENKKERYANKDCVLIDDRDSNLSAFASHGGCTVRVPRVWNVDYEISDSHAFNFVLERVKRVVQCTDH